MSPATWLTERQSIPILKKLYYNPKQNPTAFGGSQNLIDAAASYEGIKPSVTRKWLRNQPAFTLHKPARTNFLRSRVTVNGIDDQWQADLVDVQRIKKYNDDYRYLLTVIDVLSKFAWVIPLKNKTGQTLIDAFDLIFTEEQTTPDRLQTDKGTEFTNKKFKRYLATKHVHHFVTYNDPKAQVAERFNRTLKERLWRYFTHAHSYRYVDVLDDLVESYNKSYHSSIGMAPEQVTVDNAQDVWRFLYGKDLLQRVKKLQFKFKVGDRVRISKNKGIFAKGYTPNWTEEIFTVARRNKTMIPPNYRLKEYDGTWLKGNFYEQELQKVTMKDTDMFQIDYIVKTTGAGRRKKHLVHWRGWPKKYDSWISANAIRNLR